MFSFELIENAQKNVESYRDNFENTVEKNKKNRRRTSNILGASVGFFLSPYLLIILGFMLNVTIPLKVHVLMWPMASFSFLVALKAGGELELWPNVFGTWVLSKKQLKELEDKVEVYERTSEVLSSLVPQNTSEESKTLLQ